MLQPNAEPGLQLALLHRFESAAKCLCHIAAAQKRQPDHGTAFRADDNAQLWQAEIQKKQLNQQRRIA